jgi:biopolymer transport protein ExbD
MLSADPEVLTLRRKVVEENEMDITPMIDITFLLLIFFVVTSKLDDDVKIPLPPAKYASKISTKDAIVLSVVNVEGELPVVYKGEGVVEKERILASAALEQDEQIAEYVEDELAGSPNKLGVLIQADKALKTREVQRIARAACRASENLKLYYKVQEE